jgi:5-(carboxyamino)imidazole ribonucleotide mutase
VATVGIGNARNAGLLAVRILAAHDVKLRERVEAWQRSMAEESRAKNATLGEKLR